MRTALWAFGGAFVLGLIAFGLFVLSLIYADEFYKAAPKIADPYFCFLQERLVGGDEGHLPEGALRVAAIAETDPESVPCDSADDPAIWVNLEDPAKSFILGANKRTGLSVFDLSGRRVSEFLNGGSNNVDLRVVSLDGRDRIIVAASNPKLSMIELLELDPVTGELSRSVGEQVPTQPEFKSEGFCLWDPRQAGLLYAFVIDGSGAIQQYELRTNNNGKYSGHLVRTMRLSSQSEGCVADDATGTLFVAEEEKGIWRFAAAPDTPVDGELIALTGLGQVDGGTLEADVEGLAIYAPDPNDPYAGYLIASAQGNNSYVVYDRAPPHAYRGTFQIQFGDHIVANTDGLEVAATSLGADYPKGLLAVQDGWMRKPGQGRRNQNYKFVSWAEVATTLELNDIENEVQ